MDNQIKIVKNNVLKKNTLTKKIGVTTYEVTLFFNETNKETVEDKILRIIAKTDLN